MPLELRSAPTRARAQAPARRFVLFAVGGVDYAVDAPSVRRLLPGAERSGDEAVFLGKSYPIIDLRARFQLPPRATPGLLLLMETAEARAALVVDTVSTIGHVEERAIDALPPTFAGRERAWFRGFARMGERVVVIVDANGMLK